MMKSLIIILIVVVSLSNFAMAQKQNPRQPTAKQQTPPPPSDSKTDDGKNDDLNTRRFRRFVTPEENRMLIPGFGKRAIFLMVLRELDLTDTQKQSMTTLSTRIGRKLVLLRQDLRSLNEHLEIAIYGENFNRTLVDQLAAQAGEKSAELIKLQASIEAEFRTILAQDQFDLYLQLISDILPQQRSQTLKRIRNKR